jgi:decaprenylphospho-beta-D-ribofuranose 2-oxidase
VPEVTRALLTGWGGTAATTANTVVADADRVAEVLAVAGPRGVIARGLGRSYGDPAQNAGGDVLLPLPSWIEVAPDAATVRTSAGTSLHELMLALLPHGRFLPVSPGTRFVTVGGSVACDVHGKGHHRTGTFGSNVASVDLVTADGTRHSVGPDRDPELFWATIGGLGLTGVVLAATLATIPVESAWMRVTTRRTDDLDDTMLQLREADARHGYSVAWVDTLATGGSLGRGVVGAGDHARAAELEGPAARDPWRLPGTPRLTAPRTVPPHLVSWPTARLFNEAWYRKAPRSREGELQPLGRFFHPLDGIGEWHRLYGRRGFVQYQLVVPDGAVGDDALRTAVEMVATVAQPALFSVLKRFGPANAGLLSFPCAGWTLALDLPVGPGLADVLDRLDVVVVEAGGRVYLAKDARLPASMLRQMYPGLDSFLALRDRVDPGRLFVSDMSRRLGL